MDAPPDTEWVYDDTLVPSWERLLALGPYRPVWTYHFISWRAFKHYVRGCLAGERQRYPDWYAPEEWQRAVREVTDP